VRVVSLYRVSDASYVKPKLPHADKLACLDNFLAEFGSADTLVFADKCKPETLAGVRERAPTTVEITAGSSAASWRAVARYALENLAPADFVYFVEDDYLHRPGAGRVLREGLEIADYVTLYDHPDKYLAPERGGNPAVREGGESTRVLHTASSHWKLTNSTTMTFATRVSTLRADKRVWWWFSRGVHPWDYHAFRHLTRRKLAGRRRRLVSPIPGYSTHAEIAWLAPLIDWTSV
jgi:hypothetical protein